MAPPALRMRLIYFRLATLRMRLIGKFATSQVSMPMTKTRLSLPLLYHFVSNSLPEFHLPLVIGFCVCQSNKKRLVWPEVKTSIMADQPDVLFRLQVTSNEA